MNDRVFGTSKLKAEMRHLEPKESEGGIAVEIDICIIEAEQEFRDFFKEPKNITVSGTEWDGPNLIIKLDGELKS